MEFISIQYGIVEWNRFVVEVFLFPEIVCFNFHCAVLSGSIWNWNENASVSHWLFCYTVWLFFVWIFVWHEPRETLVENIKIKAQINRLLLLYLNANFPRSVNGRFSKVKSKNAMKRNRKEYWTKQMQNTVLSHWTFKTYFFVFK